MTTRGHHGLLLGAGGGPPVVLPKVRYRPNDLATLFQDSAGTIPVTSDGDPVGLMLNASPGYTAADMMQASAGARPIYRTSGGKSWLQGTGSQWMYSRSNNALAFPVANTYCGLRKNAGFADYGAFIGHPYDTTHVSPFWTWCMQGRDSGGITIGFTNPNGTARQDLSVPAAAIGTDFIYTFGVGSMWSDPNSAQRNNVCRISKIPQGVVSAATTVSYLNTNLSTIMGGAGGADKLIGNWYGADVWDVAAANQAEVDANEALINALLQVPV